jgi:hypothetical protein
VRSIFLTASQLRSISHLGTFIKVMSSTGWWWRKLSLCYLFKTIPQVVYECCYCVQEICTVELR